MKNPKRQGEIAQAYFIHRALRMGFSVLEPFGDSERFDYVLHRNGRFLRTQVRSTSSLVHANVYSVCTTFKTSHGRGPILHLPYTEKEIDLLAAVVVPEDTLYLFPVAALRGRRAVHLNSRNHPKPGRDAEFKEAWHLFLD